MTSLSSDVVEEELDRILRTAGIDSCPIDPSSMQSLRQLVVERIQGPSKYPPQAASPCKETPERTIANVTQASDSSPTDASGVVGNVEASAILKQLKMQTDLILGLQRQVEALSNKVERLEGNSDATHSTEKVTITSRIRYIPQSNGDAAPAPRNPAAQSDNHDADVEHPPLHQPRRRQVRTFFGCLSEVIRLFWVKSRDYVRPLDGALLFKLFFMVMVVTARISRSSNENADGKIRMVTMLLLIGFMYHTRYLQYIYHFFWKENVPARVWDGDEDIVIPPPAADDGPHNNDDAQQQQQQQQQQQRQPMGRNPVPPRARENQGQPDNRNNWWRNGFLAGGIAPAADPNDLNHPENANVVISLARDMLYLVGSFVMSIFPMWNPEGQHVGQPVEQQQLDGQVQDANAEGNGNAAGNAQGNGNAAGNAQGIPEVQPPGDAMEAADSDNEQ
eukprot:scaffold2828_cov126-Cylindrotheca_fusiformis.AAC.3